MSGKQQFHHWDVSEKDTILFPFKLNSAHRFLLAWQRLVDLKEFNPTGKGSDDQDG